MARLLRMMDRKRAGFLNASCDIYRAIASTSSAGFEGPHPILKQVPKERAKRKAKEAQGGGRRRRKAQEEASEREEDKPRGAHPGEASCGGLNVI